MKWFGLIFLGVLGAILGSFACCQAWRIRVRGVGEWSECMKCGHRLRWYENIPVVSWAALRGKCRKCRKSIGFSEIVAEVGLAVAFVLLGAMRWDKMFRMTGVVKSGAGQARGGGWIRNVMGIVGFDMNWVEVLGTGLLLVMFVLFVILAVYDAKWGELPMGVMIAANVVAVGVFVTKVAGEILQREAMGMNVNMQKIWEGNLLGLMVAVGVLAGVYFLLYFFSKERLVGGGDWILCLAIAIALSDAKLAILELFLSNVLTLVFSAPMVVMKKKKQVAFGPFLVVAFMGLVIFGWG